jgi:hypothetical protein
MTIKRGTCHSIFVYDAAFAIDLNEAERRITSFKQRETIKHKRRAPRYFDYRPAPLRISQEAGIELVVYDFGAVSVIYRTPLQGDFADLLRISEDLYENDRLLSDSRRRVEGLLALIGPAVSKANVAPFVEDYLIFQVEGFEPPVTVHDLTTRYAPQVTKILRAESREPSQDEISDALSQRISYGEDDITIIDWNAALVVDSEPEDALTVLEFANVELLEMRFLDQRLDDALGSAYERLSKRTLRWLPFGKNSSDLRDISQWQMDSAILFEGVNNALKLLGDQYLARLYRMAANRFHLQDWDSSIIRKLDTLQSIYQKISDEIVTRRMEALEWIIIILIAVSIVLPFF